MTQPARFSLFAEQHPVEQSQLNMVLNCSKPRPGRENIVRYGALVFQQDRLGRFFSHSITENKRVRVLILLLVFVCNLALAQSPEPPRAIALIPLDSRPATSSLPVAVGAVGGVRVVTPMAELLGNATRSADADAIRAWVEATQPTGMIVSLDALAYGGLVQSRSSTLTADEAWDRLWPVWLWHLSMPVSAFVVIPRHPDAVDRERNLEVIRRALDWAENGTLKHLYVTWDDALSGSPAPQEGETIRQQAEARGLNNVLVHPGADEVASTLVSRLILEQSRAKPRVRVRFSNPAASVRVIAYEGQPLTESFHQQARAVGFELVESGSRADLTLFVFNGGNPRTAALEVSRLQDQTPVALVDVEAVNRANTVLMQNVLISGAFARLASFAAWGTPGNNIGSALAHAALFVARGSSVASSSLLARSFVNDYLYSSLVRSTLRQTRQERDFANDDTRQALLERLRTGLNGFRLGAYRFSLEDAFFPWSRSFEISVRLRTILPTPICPPTCMDGQRSANR